METIHTLHIDVINLKNIQHLINKTKNKISSKQNNKHQKISEITLQ